MCMWTKATWSRIEFAVIRGSVSADQAADAARGGAPQPDDQALVLAPRRCHVCSQLGTRLGGGEDARGAERGPHGRLGHRHERQDHAGGRERTDCHHDGGVRAYRPLEKLQRCDPLAGLTASARRLVRCIGSRSAALDLGSPFTRRLCRPRPTAVDFGSLSLADLDERPSPAEPVSRDCESPPRASPSRRSRGAVRPSPSMRSKRNCCPVWTKRSEDLPHARLGCCSACQHRCTAVLGSRASLLTFGLETVIVVAVVVAHGTPRVRRGAVVLVVVVVLGAGVLLSGHGGSTFGKFTLTKIAGEVRSGQGSGGVRFDLQIAGLRAAATRYFLGVGPGNAETVVGRQNLQFTIVNLHDWWLEVFVDGGLPALLIFVTIYLMALRSAVRVARWARDPLLRYLGLATAVSLAGLTVAMIGPSTAIKFPPMAILLGLAVAVLIRARREGQEQSELSSEPARAGLRSAIEDPSV